MRKVLVLCLLICFVFALTAFAFDEMGKSATVNAWVVDDKCGAKGANAGGEACTKKCLAARREDGDRDRRGPEGVGCRESGCIEGA